MLGNRNKSGGLATVNCRQKKLEELIKEETHTQQMLIRELQTDKKKSGAAFTQCPKTHKVAGNTWITAGADGNPFWHDKQKKDAVKFQWLGKKLFTILGDKPALHVSIFLDVIYRKEYKQTTTKMYQEQCGDVCKETDAVSKSYTGQLTSVRVQDLLLKSWGLLLAMKVVWCRLY